MADVFLSYAAEDLPRVRPLIAALEDRGLSIWWDRKIPPGKTYTQVIRENLNAATLVLVVWSKHSVNSEWVQIEATKGNARGVLVPAMIDPVADDIPWEFSLIQAANLVGWRGDIAHEEFEDMIRSLLEHAAARPTGSRRPRARVTRTRPTVQSTPRDRFVAQLKKRGWGRGDPYISESSPNIYYADNYPHKKPRIAIRGTRIRLERLDTGTGAYGLWKSFSLEHESDAALKSIDQLGRSGPTQPLHYYYGAPPDD